MKSSSLRIAILRIVPGIVGPLLLSFASCEFQADADKSSSSRPGDTARQYVDEFTHCAGLEAEAAFAKTEKNRLQAEAVSLSQFTGFEQLSPETQAALGSLMLANVAPLIEDLDRFTRDRQREIDDLQANWLEVRTQRDAGLIELGEAEASKHAASRWASLLAFDNRWFWLCGLVAVAVLLVVAWHDRRHELRRKLNGGKARALGLARLLTVLVILLGFITAGIFIFGDELYRRLVRLGGGQASPAEQIGEALSQLQARRAAAEADRNQQSQAAAAALAAWTGPNPSADKPAGQLLETWKSIRQRLESALVAVGTKAALAAAIERDIAQLDGEIRPDLAANAEAIADARGNRKLFTLGVGFGLTGIVVLSAFSLVRGVQRRRTRVANTCPLCLGVNTLSPAKEMSSSGGVEMLQCGNVITHDPYEECDFTFLSVYRELTKLCFPTLGHPGSGKTLWLSMSYRELNKGNHPPDVQFEKVRSQSSEAFDRIVNDIITARMNPEPTQLRIPHPLVFNFRDRDRYGRSNILVNIFDYSGEVLERMTLADAQRQRALDADGYLFFLDPTERAELQAEELVNFREDVRIARKVRAGKAIQAPVALCVSKIDLLVSQPFADPGGGGAVGRFYEKMAEIDPSGQEISLRNIRAKSELLSRLRDTIWPGWQIERQVDDLFGGRYMFFPLTPVGLGEPGETDLSHRTLEPFGILEPLLWLLHMNGYPVLK